VLISVLVGASIGSWVGGLFGGFVAALLAIPAGGALQVIVREAWRITGPPPGAPSGDQPPPAVQAAGEVTQSTIAAAAPAPRSAGEVTQPAAAVTPDPRADSPDRVSTSRPK
jgi:hypothetical protein